jgi:YfiH family protein
LYLTKNQDEYLFRSTALDRLPGLVHGFSCRLGGASRSPFDGFNLSPGVGDEASAVHANRRRLRQLTGGRHVYARQRHGIAIGVIDRGVLDGGGGIRTHLTPVDALITDEPGLRLVIRTADCQAVMVADFRRRVVANIHCGWRGSVANIIGRTIDHMVAGFGCRPADMVAAIGPSLGPCCAEFVNYRQEIPRSLWDFRVGRHHFDFWRISRHQLVSAGLMPGRVWCGNLCTRCNPHLFYSYRSARTTGRMGAVIGLERVPSRGPAGGPI